MENTAKALCMASVPDLEWIAGTNAEIKYTADSTICLHSLSFPVKFYRTNGCVSHPA